MKRVERFLRLALLLVPLAAGGCAFSLGGGSNREIHRPTIGQQLIDLKSARDRGALTDAEYERERRKIIQSTR